MTTIYENASILRQEVSGELPNVPNPVVDMEIVLSTRTLCDRIALFQVTGSVTAASRQLALDALEDDNAEVVRVMPRGVSQNNAQLPQYVRPNPPSSEPLGFYIQSRRLLLLTGAPQSKAFQVTAQMRPSPKTRQLPSSIVRDYHDIVVFGALSRLYRKSGTAWADPNAAQANWTLFENGIKRVRSEVARIYTEAQS